MDTDDVGKPVLFSFDKDVITLRDIVESNDDDPELIAWAKTAAIGDRFPTVIGPVVRVQ